MPSNLISFDSLVNSNTLPIREKCHKIYNHIEETVNKCALTIFTGIGTFFLCEGIVRIPFLVHSTTYLPIHHTFVYIGSKLITLQNGMEFIVSAVLKSNYTDKLYFCVCGPIFEEIAHRFIFQEIILKQGMKFCVKQLGLSFDPNSTYAKVFRVGLSSIVFAAHHWWAFSTSPAINPYGAAALVYLVVMGSILGAAQEKTGNVAYPMAIHIINNTLTYYFT